MDHASEKEGSLHTSGAISLITRKERMEKVLGRLVVVEGMFKVTHVKKSSNPEEEERWIEPRAKDTYPTERGGDCGIKGGREQEVCSASGPTSFLFESGNILPPCPANSDDGADQEGDENDRVIKESDGDNE
ncbi:hypothetical protein EJD97_000137 [Solanum chilense]|uniref:Uncharacterized protein n=1 Tax=Solanum chilense TaxID=4083 RepID=A0A6N2ANK6_SOLCI|nr:hypothetical protein EJD97_000137 [Solanum chilense]